MLRFHSGIGDAAKKSKEDDMDSLVLLVYLAEVFWNLKMLFFIFSIVLIFGGLLVLVATFVDCEELSNICSEEEMNRSITNLTSMGKKLLYSGFVFLTLFLIIPSKTTMDTFIAIKSVEIVNKAQEVKEAVPNSVEVIEAYFSKKEYVNQK